jgi:hypothetical protein
MAQCSISGRGWLGIAACSEGLTEAWQHDAAGAAQAFTWVFYADAACIAMALLAVMLTA